MSLSKQALRNLSRRLPSGAINQVAADLEVSHTLVSQVLQGNRRNERVLEALIAFAEKHEAHIAQLEQRAMGRTLTGQRP